MRRLGFSLVYCLFLLVISTPASAQYMYLDANGDGIWTAADSVRVPGKTRVSIWLRTDQNRDGSPAVCAAGGSLPLAFSYEFNLLATGGTLAWGAYTNSIAELNQNLATASDSTHFYVAYIGSGQRPPGLYKLGTLEVVITSGSPTLDIAAENPAGPYWTMFGSMCGLAQTITSMQLGSEWLDVDGLASPSAFTVFLETFDLGTALPAGWTSTSSGTSFMKWEASLCGYRLGNYSATGTGGNGYCNSYPPGIDNALTLTSPYYVSRFKNYRVSLVERHNLMLADLGHANDVLSYGFLAGSASNTLTNIGASVLTGDNGDWTRATSGPIDNSNHQWNYAKPVFGVQTFQPSLTGFGAWIDSVQVFGTQWADIVVDSAVAYACSTSVLTADRPWCLRLKVRNAGDTLASASTLRLRARKVGGATLTLGTVPIPTLNPDERVTFTLINLPFISDPGSYNLLVDLDINGNIYESALDDIPEQNNAFTTPAVYTWASSPKPDLVVPSISVSNASPAPGDTTIVTVVVRNNGLGASGASTVGLYKDRTAAPPIGAAPDLSQSVPALAAGGGTATLVFQITSLFPDTMKIYALANWNGTSSPSESTMANNSNGPRSVYWLPGLVTIRGSFTYDDSVYGGTPFLPCLPVSVYYHRDNSSQDSLVATGTTQDSLKSFEIGPIINLDPTPPPGGDAILDLYLRIDFKTHSLCWGNPADTVAYWPLTIADGMDSVWHYDTPVVQNIHNGTYDFKLIKPMDYAHKAALHIYRALFYKGWGYFDRNGVPPGPTIVRWEPGYIVNTAWNHTAQRLQINGQYDAIKYHPDEWDDWVLLHEYGHRFAEWFGFLNTDSLPSQTQTITGTGSLHDAWREGWAHYIGAERQRGEEAPNPLVKNVGRDPDGTTQSYGLELEQGEVRVYVPDGNLIQTFPLNDAGPNQEVSVASTLWDIFDQPNDNPNNDQFGDSLSGGSGVIFQALAKYRGPAPVNTICDFEALYLSDWCCDQTFRLKSQGVFREHGMFCSASNNPTGVEIATAQTRVLRILPNAPNPFNPRTRVRFTLPTVEFPRPFVLRIYDVSGRLVRELARGTSRGGAFSSIWDGTTGSGAPAGSGVYYCNLTFGGEQRSLRVTLLK